MGCRCLITFAVLVLTSFTNSILADTLTFQAGVFPNSGTTDTWLQGASGNANQGPSTVLEWDGEDFGGQNLLLLRFDEIFGTLPGQIQPTDVITSATLSYSCIDAGDGASVNEVLVDWSPPSPTTFNNFGGDPGVQTDEFGAPLGIALGAVGIQSLNVTSSIASWALNPSLNRGWIFRPTQGTNGAQIRSSEASQLTERPLLTVVINEGPPPPAQVIRGPYLQMVTSSSIVVRWRTDNPTTSGVRFGTSPSVLTDTVTTSASVLDHEVALTGLDPSTRYYYAIGTDAQDLAGDTLDHFFVTSPVAGTTTPFRVWSIGDFGTAGAGQLAVRDAYYNFAGSDYTNLWLMLGDNAYFNGTDTEYQQAVFNVYEDLLVQTPFTSTRGNHETSSSVYYGLVTNPTIGQAGGVASGTEAFFSFDYGNVHFVCLDSEGSDLSPSGPMLTWLELDLATTTQDWIVAYFHHPPYTKGTHDSDNPLDSSGKMRDMRQNALPVLEAGGVDLTLAGHSHVYERSYLIDGHYGTTGTWNSSEHLVDGGSGDPFGAGSYTKDSDPNQGAVYIVMGSSGQLGTGTLNHPAMYKSVPALGSIVLDFDGYEMTVTMVRNDGGIEDVFNISKIPPADCNANGIPDVQDIDAGTSADCNSDDIPDECQILKGDCNLNGLLDACEILAGTATDCNGNGLLDSCDLDAGATDCDLDGIIDSCELDSGTAFDCNRNGVLDNCDLAAAVELDCNSNGVPDSCDIASGIELDCDGNFNLDSCDISAGAIDCDLDGDLDSCELISGTGFDCNANGVLDNCDIAAGNALDCDENGVPDDCDLSAGVVADCNNNSIPDSCDIDAGEVDCDLDGIPDSCELIAASGFDCNANGILDNCDIVSGVATDCDGNTVPDLCDLAAGATDCDSNGVPDVCQVDTDNDGTIDVCDDDLDGDNIPNDCDIDQSAGIDCDLNGALDSCDLAAGAADCDSNGVPDACQVDTDDDGLIDSCDSDLDGDNIPNDCDIDQATGVDCDQNGALDSCDLAAGAADCDSNGVPDACQIDTDNDGTIDVCDDDLDGDNIPNDCDIDQTAGIDCDLNGALDSCDLAAGAADCDSNGVPDVCQVDTDDDGLIDSCDSDLDGDNIPNDCDIDQAAGVDCDLNGALDSCDIAAGASDCDLDGVPDSCQLVVGADTLTFQAGVFPDSGTTDTWLQGASGNANQDTSTVLEWDGEDLGGQNFLLLRFDEIFGTLPGQIQPTDVIVSATLTYSCIDPGDGASVNEVLVDWSPPSPVTFNNFGGDPGVQADEFGAPLGIASGAVGIQSIDVTSSIASWALDPSLNRGWIFRPTQGTNGAQIRSSEASQLTERPLLTVVINETGNDCDDNGVLDSCDLAVPGSDENADGILDLCQGSPFRRGDGNQDGSVDITDAIQALAFLFGNLLSDCPPALDFNGDGGVDIADVVLELDFIFLGGPDPAAPYPDCGIPEGFLNSDCDSFVGCP